MRRGRISRGGGSGSLSSSGPLYTDHLQDINIELDLLKRKREMLEKQQQQFIQPLIPQNNFNQLPYYVLDQKPAPSNRDFSSTYNTKPERYSEGYQQIQDGHQQHRELFTRKRQSHNDWPQKSYPKKSAVPRQLSSSSTRPSPSQNQKSYTSNRKEQTNFTPLSYQKPKPFINQRINNQEQQRPSKEVFTNKVTKPTKASVPPNKLASQQLANRNKLVAASVESVIKIKKTHWEDLRLHPDKEPTKQVIGRLELALGTILRDMRDTFGSRSYHQLLRLQRAAKVTIRERIRNVMLGKFVGSTVDILNKYRAVYPESTDIELVKNALETENIQVENESRLIDKDDPEEYFKTNVVMLVERHLNETFDKLHNIYNPPVSTAEERTCHKEDTAQENGKMVEENGEAAQTVVTNSEEQMPANSVKATLERANIENSNEFNEYQRLMPRLIKSRMHTIMCLLNKNKGYRKDLDEIISYTRAKFVKGGASELTSSTVGTLQPSGTPRYDGFTYYVKIMGKPKLPNRTEMNTFLKEFMPKSVKKHRTIHNLLFVGLIEKNSFDAIVKANGTVIGKNTLSIRVCEKFTGPPRTPDYVSTSNSNTDENASQNQEIQNISSTSSDIIGKELLEQIDDLLASIRRSDENESKVSIKSDSPEEREKTE